MSSTTRFETGKPTDYNWDAILDLDRVIPCVEGGKVLERTSPEQAKAEIKVKMGAMSMTFKGTVEVAERDEAAHTRGAAGQVARHRRIGLRQRRRRVRARTTAAARSTPPRRSAARPRRWARASCSTVLDALIKDFTQKLAAI